MRLKIKKLLREKMIPFIDEWKNNVSLIKKDDYIVVTTLISKDTKTYEKFWLIVGFKILNDISEYSYSFLLTDNDNKMVSNGYLTNRNEVSKILPNEIKNKNKIFPIIKDMTRMLLDDYLPEKILRETTESLTGDSLERYEQITQLMINEYNYQLVSKEKTIDGRTIWILNRGDVNDKNKEMNETYDIVHLYSQSEKGIKMFEAISPLLKDYNFKPIFTDDFEK